MVATVGVIAAGALTAGASAYSASQQAKAAKQGTTQTSAPWSVQAPYLHHGFESAKQALNERISQPGYQGPFEAGFNPNIQAGLDRMVGYSLDTGINAGNALTGTGLIGLNAFGQGVTNAQDLFARALADPTQTTIDRAGQFASNPYIDGLIDASLRDVNRNLQLGLAANNANAVGTGNMNSTRAGVTEALLTSAAQDRAADIASQIRSGAYSQGLGLAAQQYQNQFGNALGANNQGLQAASAGADFLARGTGIIKDAAQTQLGAGLLEREIANALIQGDIRRSQYDDNRALDLIAKYQQIVGGNYGGTTHTTTPYTGPDPFSAAIQGGLGGAMQAYGLFNSADLFGSRSRTGWGYSPTSFNNYVNTTASAGGFLF